MRKAKATLRCLQHVFLWFFLGAGSRLESVGEDDELTVENGESNYEIAVKYSRGGRKHSLPQQLESAGARKVSGKAELAVSTSLCWVLWHETGSHRYIMGLKPGLDTKNGMCWPPVNFFEHCEEEYCLLVATRS